MEMKKIILASTSPRRHALMKQIGVPFTVRTCEVEEKLEKGAPSDLVKSLSIKKAIAVLHELQSEAGNEEAVIIGADTLVSLQGKVFGKPVDKKEAFDMLKMLQGKRHTVYTGVALVLKSKADYRVTSFVDYAHVFMRPLTDYEIRAYVETGEPLDKAGAYGVQEKGALWIEKIDGNYYTVMGLPLEKLYTALQEFCIEPTSYW